MAQTVEPFPGWTQWRLAEDRDGRPQRHRLYDALRGAILAGEFLPGARLPPSRTLATHLGISRNTVLDAYDRLGAEGFVAGHARRGTIVASGAAALSVGCAPVGNATTDIAPSRYTQRAIASATAAAEPVGATFGRSVRPFRPGTPSLFDFPVATWRSVMSRRLRDTDATELLGYGDPPGYSPLREVIATYVRRGPVNARTSIRPQPPSLAELAAYAGISMPA